MSLLLFNYFSSFSSGLISHNMKSCSTLFFFSFILASLFFLHYVVEPLKYRSKLTNITHKCIQIKKKTVINYTNLSYQVSQLHMQHIARKRVNHTIPCRPLDDDTIEKIFSKHLIPRQFISYSILISF